MSESESAGADGGGAMSEFLTGNDWKWRLARTIAQGLVGVLVANIDLLVGCVVLDEQGTEVCSCLRDYS